MYREAKRMKEEQARMAREQGSKLVVNSETAPLAMLN